MSKIVTTKCYGRLGNNMFQIAAAIGYAAKYGAEVRVPLTFQYPEYRHLFDELKSFNPKEDAIGHFWPEKVHNFIEIPELDNPELNGYFQTEKYFAHARQEVIAAFVNLDKCPELDPFALSNTVGVHVRRGDYLHYQNQFPVQSRDYFLKAMYMFPEGTKFKFYSDDIDWCKQAFFASDPDRTFSEETDPYTSLIEMSTCAHQIISNSSFSWWAAWLNTNPEKKVIAPAVWFGPGNGHLDTSDIIPETWIKL